MVVLHTPRLRLEPLTDAHLEGLHRLNSDPEVMRYITGKPDTLADSQLMIERVKARWAEWGYSWWAFIELATGELIGAGCIQHLGRGQDGPAGNRLAPAARALAPGLCLRGRRTHGRLRV